MEKEITDVLRPLLSDLDDGLVCRLSMYFDGVKIGDQFYYPHKSLKACVYQLLNIIKFGGFCWKYVEKKERTDMQTYIWHRFHISLGFIDGKRDEIN